MDCIYCDSERLKVSKTINVSDKIIKRIRYCQSCGKYFTTVEVAEDIIRDMFIL